MRAIPLMAAFCVVLAGGARAQSTPAPAIAFGELPINSADARPQSADIHGAAIARTVRDIADLTLANRPKDAVLWGRIAGTPADKAMIDYVQRRFDAIGLERVAATPITLGPQWTPTHVSLSLLGQGGATALTSVMPGDGAPGLAAGGTDAELVWGGLGTPADLAGKDVRGKGVVIRTLLKPATFFSTGRPVPADLAKLGAAFVVVIVDAPEDGQFLLPGQAKAGAPVFVISSRDGALIERAFASGVAPHAHAELAVEQRAGGVSRNVLGLVRGQTDETIVLTAHTDSYFVGANDNASGVAMLIALADHIAHLKTKPRKTYLFAATTAHHTAEFSPGTRQLTVEQKALMDRALFDLNLEHLAPVDNREWVGAAAMGGGVPDGRHASNTETAKFFGMQPDNPLIFSAFRAAVDRYGVTVERQAWRSVPGDAGRITQAGYQALQLIDIGYWYHDSLDTPDTVSQTGLERVGRAYADFLQDMDRVSLAQVRSAAVKRMEAPGSAAGER